MKTLGIDYGTKKCGLALTDIEGHMAFPYSVVPTEKLLSAVQKLIVTENVGQIVVGHSLGFDRKPNVVMAHANKFIEVLQEETGISAHLEEELFSTKLAEHIQGKHEKIDASAAALILQSFLDRKIHKKYG